MNIKIKITLLIAIFIIQGSEAKCNEIKQYQLIPTPANITYTENGKLILPKKLTVSKDFPESTFKILVKSLQENLNAEAKATENKKSIISYYLNKSLGNEAYELEINAKGIKIYASSTAGCLWAVQTLNQMFVQLKLEASRSKIELMSVYIKDEPKYGWRSFHMDVSRHFFTKEYVNKTIERLSFYKINKLHLHLSDDQGWRIQIDKYPLLTEIGAWRKFDRYDSICIEKSKIDPSMKIDSRFIKKDSIYGGFYTKQDIKEIIQQANKYGIEIIPEIDMPGHMSAAIRAYPWLSCTGDIGWGQEFSYPICPCNKKTIEFAKDIYSEIAELFPSKYIHIGADEVEKDTWIQNTDCKELMQNENMKSIEDIQTYFVNEIYLFLHSKGKKVLVWDDAAIGDIDKNINVLYWRDWLKENPQIIKDKGHPMIFTVWSHFYFSSRISFKRWQELYNFNISDRYPGMKESSVMGYQACVWTEEIPNESKFEEHVYPSLQAFSESIWSKTRDWDNFLSRLNLHNRWMDSEKMHYHRY